MSSVITNPDDLTATVVEAMAGTANPRLREVMAALVSHLHAFAREVHLTEPELEEGVAFLNAVGQATTSSHNEGVLLADILGVSTLVCLMSNRDAEGRDGGAALLGPFWRQHAPVTPNGGSILRGPTAGEPVTFVGRVADPAGAPVADATVDIWQASPAGLYENQDPQQAAMNFRGRFVTGADGRFSFRTVRPAGYPVPTHGPCGPLLAAQARKPQRPAHIHVMIHKPGFRTLITQVFTDTRDRLGEDVVFGATEALAAQLTPDGVGGYTVAHAFTLAPGEARLPVAPIQ